MRIFLFLCVLVGRCADIPAQASLTVPVSHLYSFELVQKTDQNWEVQNARWLTHFNPNGYNNQPYFASDDVIYFSIRFEAETQNDIYAIDLKKLLRYRVTKTKESEFSPFVDVKNASIYAVQVDKGPTNKQRLWKYPISLDNFGEELVPFDFQVGYFTKVYPNQFAVFSVEDPPRLYLLDPMEGTPRLITERVGRCLVTDENGNLLYIQIISEELQYIKIFDDSFLTAKIITRLPRHVKDFAYWNEAIWYGDKATLHLYLPEKGVHKQVADLSPYGITNITRLTIRNNTLIIVNSDEP